MRQTAGVGRLLADVVGLQDIGNGKLEQDGDDDHDQHGRDELDEPLHPLGEAPIKDIDLNVAVLEDRVRQAQHADGRHQVPLELLRCDRAGAEEIAQQHVEGHHQHDGEGAPAGDAPDAVDDHIERVGDGGKCLCHRSPRCRLLSAIRRRCTGRRRPRSSDQTSSIQLDLPADLGVIDALRNGGPLIPTLLEAHVAVVHFLDERVFGGVVVEGLHRHLLESWRAPRLAGAMP